jgi:hypothetical protein
MMAISTGRLHCWLLRLLCVFSITLDISNGFLIPRTFAEPQMLRRPAGGYNAQAAGKATTTRLHLSSSAPLKSSNKELLPGISAIDQANDELFEKLERLREIPYFRFYSVDILASCEYMPQELFECYTETCEIYPEDEDVVSQNKEIGGHGMRLETRLSFGVVLCIPIRSCRSLKRSERKIERSSNLSWTAGLAGICQAKITMIL